MSDVYIYILVYNTNDLHRTILSNYNIFDSKNELALVVTCWPLLTSCKIWF
jgi:hypothetical protein